MRLTEQQALGRYERAEDILADYQRQYDYALPELWRSTISKLLLKGLTDPELHDLFQTIVGLEIQAGRLPERKVDYAAWAKEPEE
ncbi:MAG: hypothetical protein AB7D51_01820 [Desulfovibrionaceae bacterium]